MPSEPPRVASLDDVAAYAANLAKPMLYCRDLRHSWDEVTSHVTMIDGEYHASIECRRCSTLRTRVIDAKTGARISSRYQYPDGYRMENAGRVSSEGNAILRLEAIHRMEGK